MIPLNRGANGNMDGGGKAFPRRCSFPDGSPEKYFGNIKKMRAQNYKKRDSRKMKTGLDRVVV